MKPRTAQRGVQRLGGAPVGKHDSELRSHVPPRVSTNVRLL
jgi:hypothetical protein